MAQKFTVPITVKQLASAGSDAVTVYVDQDTFSRLKVEAGGRLTWGSGASAGDVNLYRASADVLQTDDTFKTPVLFVDNIEIDPTGATTDQILKFDGTKFIASTISSGGATNLDDLSDVVITSATNGQLLEFDGTNWVNAVRPSSEPIGHEDKTDSVISFDEGSRTFSIAPVSGSYTIWCTGKRYVKTGTETVTIPDTPGLYYIYFNSSGALAYRTSYFVWDTDTPTAYIYWNADDNKAYFFADERHGVTLDWATHEYLHRTRGAVIANGFGASSYSIDGDGSSDDHAKFDLAGGTFFDEDLQVDITHSATPTANTWEQVLEGNAEIPVFYKVNTHWKKDAATEFAFKQGTSRPQYNSYSAPNWSAVDIDNNKFAISWIIATNNLNEPVIAIMGQDSYLTIGEAEAAVWEDLNLDGFPIFEFRPLHKVVFQGTDSFTNSVNAAIRGVYDLRRVSSSGDSVPSTPVSDHGSLTGLADDDHTQYLTDARHDALDHTTAMGSVVLDDISNVSAASPNTGDVLTYNGSAWTAASAGGGGGGASVTVSETPPASPTQGDLWFESDTTRTYVYYDSFWIEVGGLAPTAIVSDTAPSSPVTGQVWFNSLNGGTYVYYSSAWTEVGAVPVNNLLNLLDAKGDMFVGSADNTAAKLSVGTTGQVLTVDPTATYGVKWETIAAGGGGLNTSSEGALVTMAIGA